MQIASFAIEAITELNKNISVMNIASSAILSIQTSAWKGVVLQELEAVAQLTLFPSWRRRRLSLSTLSISSYREFANC